MSSNVEQGRNLTSWFFGYCVSIGFGHKEGKYRGDDAPTPRGAAPLPCHTAACLVGQRCRAAGGRAEGRENPSEEASPGLPPGLAGAWSRRRGCSLAPGTLSGQPAACCVRQRPRALRNWRAASFERPRL